MRRPTAFVQHHTGESRQASGFLSALRGGTAGREDDTLRIGFIGLGTMGGRMASKLIEAGHTLVVYDIEPSAAAELRERGAGWGESPADVARVSDIVLTSLPGPVEVEQVAAGDRGLAEGLQRGAVYVDLSTGSPSVVRAVAERIEAAGAHMIDAPVSGGPQGAEAARCR